MQRTLESFIKKAPSAAAPVRRKSPSPTVVDVDLDGEKSNSLHAVSDGERRTKRARSRSSSSSRSPSSALRGAKPVAGTAPHEASSHWLAALLTDADWRAFLRPVTEKHLPPIESFIDAELRRGKLIFPPQQCIFAAFNGTALASVKVVLLGQDPYHGTGQAHGLCFSVQPGVRVPPSLQNMYKELAVDIPGFRAPPHGCLQSWASQGMLMLNATLTVEAHQANSHATCGWQAFTDDVIRTLSAHHKNRLVFLLWGNFARKKKSLIDLSRHVVIENAHPSPLSARAWFGCRCFSKCNAELTRLGHAPMDWSLPMSP